MELMNLSCEGSLEELASKAAAPGGGGASALVGAAGVALGSMVGSLTVGKKKYAAVEADLRALNARAEALRRRLEALVQADAEAFLPLAAAYGLPKETPEQQAHKAAVLEQNFPLLGSIKVIRDYPNTVVVQVTEAVPAYAVQNGSKWLVISDKWKILSEESTQPEGLCTLYGGKLQDSTPGQGFWFVDDADAASASGSETAESESAVSTENIRMEALRTLRSKLEEYGLSQDVTRLEVADTEQIAFLYQDRISVLLGTLNDLDYKLDRARYVLTNADGKGCGPTDTGRLDFSHTSASSTRKIYFAQGEPTLPSGYVVPPKAEEPAPAEDAADSTDSAESTESADTADTTEPAADADTEQLPLTHPDRMTANEEENPM